MAMGKNKNKNRNIKEKINNKNRNVKEKIQNKVKKFPAKVVQKNVLKHNQVVLPRKENTIKSGLNVSKLSKLLGNSGTGNSNEKTTKRPKWNEIPLRERMWQKLKSARFRYLNEEMYTKTGNEANNYFKSDPEAFKSYHEGYKMQVSQWPINPLDVIIKSLKRLPKDLKVADFGCGEAVLSISVPQTVHSFDLVALNSRVKACDMSKTPLHNESIDIAVFCLSLMGTNLQDYLLEANRVLKNGGTLKIAEVESRFEKVDDFIQGVEKYGFKLVTKNFNNALFYFFDFKKQNTVKNRKKLPTISLNPCLYKKR